MRSPRCYQLECIRKIREAFQSGKRGVVVELFTGAGKGFIIAQIAQMVQAKGKRCLVTVNRDNLCEQLMESLQQQGLFPVMERGMDRASPMSDLVVGSIQTMQGERLKKWSPDHFGMVITDEVHFGAADTFKNTLSHFANAYHLGVSATIERHDKAGLWEGYKDCVFSMPLQEGINQGWLVPFEFEELPVPIVISDKQAVKRMWTEKDETELFSTNDYLPRLFAESAARLHETLPSLYFWPSCDASREANAHFQSMGIQSRHVDGYMSKPQIAEILEWFYGPGRKALHNADLLSYGYDNPSIGLVGIMRISRSIPMLKQRLGRGTRPACVVDGIPTAEERRAAIAASIKPQCRVLDLMIQLGDVKNTFADSTALITADPEEREFLREERKKLGRQLTMEEIEGKLKARRETDKEKQLAKLAEDAANAARKSKRQREIFISDILSRSVGNTPASDKFLAFVRETIRRNNFICQFPDDITSAQLMKIKLRVESRIDKLATA